MVTVPETAEAARKRPLVSIIVPSYRHDRYVEQALSSCVASGYPNIELIIANDASPQNDDEKIRSWLAQNPSVPAQYIQHETNRGLTRTFNECIELCTGSYITILAADDVLLPGALDKRVSYLVNHPDKLAVFTDCEVIDQAGNLLFTSGIEGLYRARNMRRRALRDERLLPFEIVFHWAVPGPVFMARREAYGIVGKYDESLTMEDWDMYLRLASIDKLGFLDDSTAQYRWHDTNVVKRADLDRSIEIRAIASRAAGRFGGIAGIYLAAYGAIEPLERDAPWNRRARAKFIRSVAAYCARSYRMYREHSFT